MNRISKTLHDNWYFTQVGGRGKDTAKEGEWLPVDSFPTTVHVELIKLKRIPDPVESSHRFIV
jgi:beta-mannosidase